MINSKLYKNTFQAMKLIFKDEGFLSLYKGFIPSIFGISHVMIQFPLYEYFKKETGSDKISSILLASFASKIIASSITYPHEVIRTRIQNTFHKQNVKDAIAEVWRNEGFGGFFKGLKVNLVRVIPATAITFTVYETVMKV